MANDVWMLEELWKIRALAMARGMPMSEEALRVAIVHLAVELGLPTGLSFEELTRVPDQRLLDFTACKTPHPTEY